MEHSESSHKRKIYSLEYPYQQNWMSSNKQLNDYPWPSRKIRAGHTQSSYKGGNFKDQRIINKMETKKTMQRTN